MKFRKFLKQWLGYSRRERTGSMVLLLILLVVLVVRTVKTRDSGKDYEAMAERINNPLQEGNIPFSDTQTSNMKWGEIPRITIQEIKPFKGGTDSRQLTSRDTEACLPPTSKEDLIDINSADSAELEALPGIGPVLSERIIKYRYLIGYFYSIDQLNDVYGLDKGVINMNRTRFRCDSSMVRKININTAAYSDLLRHPYIKRSQVDAIINYRRLIGLFNNITELESNRIFTSDEIKRLKPYLEL
ncbi:MAG: helix-hairpin-helix domain-containing protein [Bacteroidales bacterium]|nr:helix-hairpin-helix domain-containing protein [Bacteroidales bacterium]